MVIDGATALGSPISEKGLGLNPKGGEMVGIMAENCMVRLLFLMSLTLPLSVLARIILL